MVHSATNDLQKSFYVPKYLLLQIAYHYNLIQYLLLKQKQNVKFPRLQPMEINHQYSNAKYQQVRVNPYGPHILAHAPFQLTPSIRKHLHRVNDSPDQFSYVEFHNPIHAHFLDRLSLMYTLD